MRFIERDGAVFCVDWTEEDFVPLTHEFIDEHPGLEFLRDCVREEAKPTPKPIDAIASCLSNGESQLVLFDASECRESVYLQTDGEFIKIGRTKRSESRRRRENQTGNPRVLTTLAVIPNASEKALHERFAADRVRGEWFRISPDIMAFIKAWQSVEGVLDR